MNKYFKIVKTNKVLPALLALIFSLILSSCNVPASETSQRGPRAWIDKPLDGDRLPLAPVEVISHASDLSGIQEMELLVNGEQVRVDAATPDGSLSQVNQLWEPPGNGEYELVVVAHNQAGGEARSQPVTVVVGEVKAVEDVQEDTATPTPTPTEGVTPTVTFTPTTEEAACTNRIQYAGQTISDGTVFEPNTPFTKTWTLINAGTCTWTEEYALAFLNGDRLSAPSSVPLHKVVEPGDSIIVGADMIAPSSPGEYFGTWMLSDPEGVLFGSGDDADNSLWVQIVVQAPTVTPDEPTLTPTRTPTPTQAPTTPNAPSNLQITSSSCTGSGLDVTLTWNDNSTNENGFRVYRDGVLIQTLSANITTYSDTAPNKNSPYTYAVRAYNAVGNSSQTSVESPICPIP